MPELRVKGKRWLSYSADESILVLLDALGRGENGLDQISLELLGTHRSPLPDLSEDEDSLSPAPGSVVHPGDEIHLKLRRSGLYERFPWVLFADPSDYANRTGSAEAAGRLELAEEEARRIVRPFDREALFVRARMRHWTSVFCGMRSDPGHREFVWRMFGLSEACRRRLKTELDERGQTILTFLVPHLHEVVGHPERTRQVLQMFLPDSIRLEDGQALSYELAPHHRSYLDGTTRTGARGLGDSLLSSEKVLLLTISPVPPERMHRYRSPRFVSGAWGPLFELNPVGEESAAEEWGDLALTIRFLCDILMPVDLRIMLHPRSAVAGWKLETGNRGRCGLDTFAAAVEETRPLGTRLLEATL
jgi:hypothetical protein